MSTREKAIEIMQAELSGLKAVRDAGLEFTAEITAVLEGLDYPSGYTSTAHGIILGTQSQISYNLSTQIPELITQIEQALALETPPSE